MRRAFLTLVLCAMAAPLVAKEPPRIGSRAKGERFEILCHFENEAVRVVDHVLEVGGSEPEHTHAPMVAYFVQGATAAITEADGLLCTFNALLRIARIESGERRAGFTRLGLEELLRDVAELYEPLAEEKHQKLSVAVETAKAPRKTAGRQTSRPRRWKMLCIVYLSPVIEAKSVTCRRLRRGRGRTGRGRIPVSECVCGLSSGNLRGGFRRSSGGARRGPGGSAARGRRRCSGGTAAGCGQAGGRRPRRGC